MSAYVAQHLHPEEQQPSVFHAMVDLDAESDASCQASQNNPRPAAPHQLPQPSVRSCNPSNNDQWLCETVSGYFDELIERLLELLDEFPQAESDGDLVVTMKNTTRQGATPLSTSVFTEVALAHFFASLIDRGAARTRFD